MIDGRLGSVVIGRTTKTTNRVFLVQAVAIAVVATAVVLIAPRVAPPALAVGSTFVVDSVGDEPDLAMADGLCQSVVDTCTLRAAISQANATEGHDRIEFAIPGPGPHTIDVPTTLPILVDPAGVTIDGYTQPGSSPNTLDHGTDAVLMIELDGPGPSGSSLVEDDGIYIRSSDNVIRGLALFDFDKHIRIYGDDPNSSADDIDRDVAYNQIVGNFIGTDASGTFAAPARVVGADGVHIQHGAFGNWIGMPGNEHRNVISGVADRGVGLYDPGTDLNLIQNNIIGLAPGAAGTAALANVNHGVDINYGASRNTVGGWNDGEGNVVSGNGRTGVEVSHSRTAQDTERNLVVGNLIGTTADGAAATSATANGEYGIYFEGSALCTTSCPPDIRLNVAAANVIVGSQSGVVLSKGAHENTVVGNWIGVLRDGTDPFEGTSTPVTLRQGVSIEMGAFDNRIEQNVIANSQRGIHATAKDPQCPAAGTTDGDLCRAAEFAVFGNTFSMNSITNTSLQGIELRSRGTNGLVYNEGPGVSVEVNAGIAAPVIDVTGADASTTDQIEVETCVGCTVEVFATPDVSGVAWSDFGRGERFLFSGTDGAAGDPADGRVVFELRTSSNDPMVVVADQPISATATDADGNTSEFSRREPIPLGSIAEPPVPTTTTATTTTTTIPSSTTSTTTTVPGATTTLPTTTVPGVTTSTTVTVPGRPPIGGAGSATAGAVRCGSTGC